MRGRVRAPPPRRSRRPAPARSRRGATPHAAARAEVLQAERLAGHVRMQRDRHDQRVALGLPHHLVELVDDEVREGVGVHAAHHDGVGVVRLLRIGNEHQRPGARGEGDRPVVGAPVEEIAVARLLQQIRASRGSRISTGRAIPPAACLRGGRSLASPRRSAPSPPLPANRPAARRSCGRGRRSPRRSRENSRSGRDRRRRGRC